MVLLLHLTNFSKFWVMDKHAAFLKHLCRLCGNSVKNKTDVAKNKAFKRELLEKFNINIDKDSSETHPEKICPLPPPCKPLLYRVQESGNPAGVSISKTIEKWTSHVESNCRCTPGKKESTESCPISSEEATPKVGKNSKQRRRGNLV